MNNTRDYKILVIDDDKMFTQVIKSYLVEQGFRVIIRNNANDIEETIDDSINLILLDLYMPGQTGIDTLINIKKSYPDKPVIIMTGFTSNELKQTTGNLGAFEHLEKPFAMSTLQTKIEKALKT